MRLKTLTSPSQANTVPGVFAVNPIIRGEPVRLGQSHSGSAGLVQGGRIIAVGQPDLLLTYAALNHLQSNQPNYVRHEEPPTRTFVID
jgi:hypothetical protein